MKRKFIIPLLLSAALAVGAGAVEAAISPLKVTADCSQFVMNAGVWQPETVEGDTVEFAAVDLDGDGSLDLLVQEWAATAVSTYTRVYVLGEDGPEEAPVRTEGEEIHLIPIDFGMQETVHAYRDPADGRLWYVGLDIAGGTTKKYAFSLHNGEVEQKLLGGFTYDAEDGEEPLVKHYFGKDGSPISGDVYDNLEDTYFGWMEEKNVTFPWISFGAWNYDDGWKNLDDYDKRMKLYRSYEEFAQQTEGVG